MKTIAFITRVHPKRPRMLKVCIDSVKAQTDDDYIHIIHRDDKTENGYGLLLANQSFAKVSPIDARYVMAIDDDNMLIDPNFVKIFRKIVNGNNPEIVFFKVIIGSRIFPKSVSWNKSPVCCRIDGHCFAVRLDIWKKYIHEFGKPSRGDYCFISVCYKNTKNHFWLDHIVSKAQRKAGRGKGENEHG